MLIHEQEPVLKEFFLIHWVMVAHTETASYLKPQRFFPAKTFITQKFPILFYTSITRIHLWLFFFPFASRQVFFPFQLYASLETEAT